MSAAYKQTIQTAGLNNDHQGELGMLHALLVYADANHSGSDTLTGAAEVIRRLEAAGINPHALLRIKQILNTTINQANS